MAANVQLVVLGLLLALATVSVFGGANVCHHGTAHCECDFGYTGSNCDIPIDFCNTTHIISNGQLANVTVCGEHGECLSTPDGAACNCDQGWDGPYCRNPIDSCQPNPCQNGATCVNLDGPSYVCICDKLHIGQNCTDHPNFCQDEEIFDENGNIVHIHVCGDHGQCTNTPSGASCTCQPGWTGTFCQHEIEYNCTSGGVTHPHGSQWNERCNTCNCEYGKTTCSKGYWCPERCAIFSTPLTEAKGLTVGCKPYENCIPDTVACARENPACDFPIGWCFPVGVVMLDHLTTPSTNN